jgi:hypothetical protein
VLQLSSQAREDSRGITLPQSCRGKNVVSH